MLTTGINASAQRPWTDADYRNATYPPESFFVSYYSLVNEHNNVNDCVDKTLLGAQSLLANSIFSEVTSSSKSSIEAVNSNSGYSEIESFSNDFKAAASAQLVHVHIEHFYDAPTKTAHALAYVNKNDLSEFCESKLRSDIAAVTRKLQGAEELTQKGYKAEAKKTLEEAEPILRGTPVYLAQLMAIGKSTANATGYATQLETLGKRLAQMKSDMQHGITVFIDSDQQSQFVKGNTLSGKCKGILSAKGCSFVDSADQADFVVRINCSTRTSSNTGTGWFAFADIEMTVTRMRDNSVVYDDAISVKGGGGTEERAHRKAIDLSPKQICDHIIKCIQ